MNQVNSSLWSKAIAQTQYALKTGALQTIATEYERVEDGGIPFLVRILTNLGRKEKAKKKQAPDFNPFLPYEADLFVSDLSATHVCLLNKYNVVENHLLIITRHFEEQEMWLTLEDFQALGIGLREINGLGFYNGGKLAGASQRHKHLQLVPFSLVPEMSMLPIESVIPDSPLTAFLTYLPSLPFCHCFSFLDTFEDPDYLWQKYRELLQGIGLKVEGTQQTGAYNLLVTRRWMMVVGRSQEKFKGISINSLGFAGALLVKNREKLRELKTLRPLQILQGVSYPL